MPYFVYHITSERKLTLLDTFEKFKEAKEFVRGLRAQLAAGSPEIVRMIFAENPKKAQLLLTDPRNVKTDGDD